MEFVLTVMVQHLPTFVEQAAERVVAAYIPAYEDLPRDVLHTAIERAFQATIADMQQGANEAFPALLRATAKHRMHQGAQVTDILRGFNIGFEVVSEHLREAYPNNLAAQLWWEQQRHQSSFAASIALTEQMITMRDEQIREQASQIYTLSTPLIPVYPGVLALPLVGAVDPRRATQILEALLEGIAHHQADVVIVDLTGVAVVDEVVTQYLVQAARAAQLLGAQVIFVGIRSEVAQMMVQLEIDVTHFVICADFQAGVEYALSVQGWMITRAGASPALAKTPADTLGRL
jgi:rsbT co-antagonist protein RsbR